MFTIVFMSVQLFYLNIYCCLAQLVKAHIFGKLNSPYTKIVNITADDIIVN